MRIAIDPGTGAATVLATDAAAVDSHAAPPSDLHLAEEATVQESKPIRSGRRNLYGRGNVTGGLTFTVRPRYSSLAKAAEGAWALAMRRGLTGELSVKAGSGSGSNAASGETADADGRRAIVQKVETRQIGVTVEAKYEIVF